MCALAAILPDGREIVVEGRVDGVIADAPRGSAGFGYDPLFVPEGDSRTVAELTPDEKDVVSHRGRASRALAAALRRGRRLVNLAAALLPFVVALPPGAVAPPPGAVPRAAQITVLDRELGLVAVRLPRSGVSVSLRRLRSAPGVRYVERDVPVTLAAVPEGVRRRRL